MCWHAGFVVVLLHHCCLDTSLNSAYFNQFKIQLTVTYYCITLYCPVNKKNAWSVAHLVKASICSIMKNTAEQVRPKPVQSEVMSTVYRITLTYYYNNNNSNLHF